MHTTMAKSRPVRKDSISGQPYYVGSLSRDLTEAFLLDGGKSPGLHLVRKGTDGYRLSLLAEEMDKIQCFHYKIDFNKVNRTYSIEPSVRFVSVASLLKFYSEPSHDVLMHHLTAVCPKLAIEITALQGLNFIDREDIVDSSDKLCCRRAVLLKGKFCDLEVVLKSKQSALSDELAVMQEAVCLHVLRHQHVVPLLGVVNASPPRLVLKFYPNKDLLGHMLESGNYEGSFQMRIRMILQITSALTHVNRMGYVHRQVRASNVLVDTNLTCKLSGFGLARKLNNDGCYTTKEGDPDFPSTSIRWMAIEAVKDKRFSPASDVWSLAALMYEVFSNGEAPYSGEITCRVFERVEAGHRPSKPETAPDAVHALMLRCWYPKVDMRPTYPKLQAILEEFRGESKDENQYETVDEKVVEAKKKGKGPLRKRIHRYISMRRFQK